MNEAQLSYDFNIKHDYKYLWDYYSLYFSLKVIYIWNMPSTMESVGKN